MQHQFLRVMFCGSRQIGIQPMNRIIAVVSGEGKGVLTCCLISSVKTLNAHFGRSGASVHIPTMVPRNSHANARTH